MELNDTIINKLNKLKALVERGVDGEAEAAKRKLEYALEKYGLTWEEFFEVKQPRKQRCFHYKSNFQKRLLLQCIVYLFGSVSEIWKDSYRYRNGKMNFYTEMTDTEYILLLDFWQFHVEGFEENLRKSEEKLFLAYLESNGLYDSNPDPNEKYNKPSKFSLSELLEISLMAKNMEKKTFYKKLNA